MKRRRVDGVALAVLLGLAALWYAAIILLEGGTDPGHRAEELRAARAMAAAIDAIAREASDRGFPPDPAVDPNRTGLIGLPYSPITTTLGSLPAKRTGAQPDAAVLMVQLLREAGVQPGARVAVESSGSFPGFAVAALVAARTMGADATALVSIGASTYGANRPDFTLADIIQILASRGILSRGAAAVSPGGDADRGRDMDPSALAAALARAAASGAVILRESDLASEVAARRALLDAAGTPSVLVSVGGSWVSAGAGSERLGRSGLIRPAPSGAAAVSGPGLIQSYLGSGIPVIRILDVADLCARTGLPFDPIPWPPAGRTGLRQGPFSHPVLVAAGPVLALLAAAWVRHRRRSASTGESSAAPPG